MSNRTEEALSDAIFALNTLVHPDASSDDDVTALIDRADDSIETLARLRDSYAPAQPKGITPPTNHAATIADLRSRAEAATDDDRRDLYAIAADLLELHDATGISLDTWPVARQLVVRMSGVEPAPNYA